MKKSVWTAWMAVMLCLIGCVTVSAAQPTWYMDGNGTLNGYIGAQETVSVPAEIEGETVIAIGDSAFRSDAVMQEIILPDGVKSIGKHAFFGCEQLRTATIPDSVETIGEGAFGRCYALEQIALPASLTEFDPLSLHFCRSLQAVTVAASNEQFLAQDGVLFSKDGSALLYYPPAKADTRYVVPETVTVIAAGAFEECNGIGTIVLPGGLQTIEDGAFLRCEALHTVEFEGREDAWQAVSIGEDNEPITTAETEYTGGMSAGVLVAVIVAPLAAVLAVGVALFRRRKTAE